MKQNRNELCKCGSGIKYKKCCYLKDSENIKTIPSKKQFKKEIKLWTKYTGLKGEPQYQVENEFKNYKDLKFMVGVNKLPTDIRYKINELYKIQKPLRGQCELISLFISQNIPGVKQVRGYYTTEERKKYGKEIMYQLFNKTSLQLGKVYEDDFTRYFLDKDGVCWSIHSWNEYNGVHFDTIKDEVFDNDSERLWYSYKYHSLHCLNEILSTGTLEYLNSGINHLSQLMTLDYQKHISNFN